MLISLLLWFIKTNKNFSIKQLIKEFTYLIFHFYFYLKAAFLAFEATFSLMTLFKA